MSTRIPDAPTGSISSPVTGTPNGVANSDAAVTANAAGTANAANGPADEGAKSVALDFDQLFKSVFQSFFQLFNYSYWQQERPAFGLETFGAERSDQNNPSVDPDALNGEIASLKQRIDSLKADAQRLMESTDLNERRLGHTELQTASQLLSLVSKLVSEQIQFRGQKLR